jgi:hypothetical protein
MYYQEEKNECIEISKIKSSIPHSKRNIKAATKNNRNVIQGKIKKYDDLLGSGNTTLTNDSTSDVDGITKEIFLEYNMVSGVKDLVVFAGYHGDTTGHFAGAFTADELKKVDQFVIAFKNVISLQKPTSGLSDDEMRQQIKDNNVFFTWCFADRRIGSL